jgi:hypothetical protein
VTGKIISIVGILLIVSMFARKRYQFIVGIVSPAGILSSPSLAAAWNTHTWDFSVTEFLRLSCLHNTKLFLEFFRKKKCEKEREK